MQLRHVLFVSATALMLALAYAATEETVYGAEEPAKSLVREKRGLHLAKKALLIGGTAFLASKALLGAGLLAHGLHKGKTAFGGYGPHAYGPPGYHHGGGSGYGHSGHHSGGGNGYGYSGYHSGGGNGYGHSGYYSGGGNGYGQSGYHSANNVQQWR